ncbi:rod shape-determining protein MreC [Natronospira bacteriovora]|uniref:Cell shape-determining protein MreC n=1 Tax=Natronospira bacteriovora TaxID=3069753 RepID=A0ABU0W408_9GAMM|nr:rod shape-determining protein MreC [Natronospira sp. AB-CW4]MDQ2068756.1 rod shape-determining protein MreC [Natronospira sp. AB-CW4]
MGTAFGGNRNTKLFGHGPSPVVRVALLILLSIVIIAVDHREGHLDRLRQALSIVTYPIQLMVDLPSAALERASETLATRGHLMEENRRLREQQLELSAQNQRLASLEQENERLRELLQSGARVGERLLAAELLQVSLDPFRHRVVVDKGSRHGVHSGQPLLDADGIMGQVTHAGLFGANAILITDPSHAIPVEVNRNGLRTIALGTGDITRLDLPYLPNSADIRTGDLLVSSGLGMRFPRGYPVAVVTEVRRRPGETFAEIHAEPAAALNRSREVLLVWREDNLPFDHDPMQLERHDGAREGDGNEGRDGS